MTYHFDTGIIGIITFVIYVYKKKKITWNEMRSTGQVIKNLSLTISNKMTHEMEFAEGKYN